MKNEDKLKEQLISELEEMRQGVAELQASENGRKQAERMLAESEEKYRLLFDKYGDPITVYGIDGRLLLINAIGAKNFGGRPEDFIGKSYAELFPVQGSTYLERHRAVALSGVAADFEDMVKLPSGERWFGSTIQPIKGENGNVHAVQIVSLDITERKQAEEALRQSEEKLRVMFESVAEGITVTDLEGNILDANEEVVRQMGYTKDEYIGQKGFEFLSPKDLTRATEDTIKRLTEGYIGATEYTFIRKDGTERPAEVNASFIRDASGNPVAIVSITRDISERKRTEKALRESEERYRSLLTNIPDVVWTATSQGNFTFMSPNIEAVTGYTPEEMYQGGYQMLLGNIHPDDVKMIMERLGPQVAGGMPLDVEYRLRSKDGEWVWLHTRTTAAYEKDGITYIDGVSTDITKRKRAEEALRQSEDRFRMLFESTREGIVLSGSDARILSVNPAAAAILGYNSQQELVGKFGPELYANLEQKKTVSRQLQEKGYIENMELALKRKDGTLVYVLGSSIIRKDSEGKVLRVETVWVDITERKQAEEALRENEERFRLLAENAQDMIYHYRLAPTPRFEYVSPAATAMLGYTPQEYYDDPELGLKSTIPEDRPVMEAMQSSSERWVVILRRIRKDGTIVWLEEKNVPIYDQAGNLVAVEGIARDITDRKRAEDALQGLYERERELGHNLAERSRQLENAYKELYKLDKMKDGFLSTVSHELRTPLTSIKSFAEILLSYDEDKETQREFLTIINDESDRLARLINALLDISRIESGRMQWQSTQLAIPDVIEVAMKSIYSLSAQKNISLNVDMRPDLPAFLGDRDRLVQVMSNLLGNAIKFTSEGGKISVVAEVLSANRAENTPAMIKISVSDTGIGIAAENHKKIFDKFIQVGDTLTDKPKGTGLGLAICKEIVEHYQGTIGVESELGQGSTFFFTLPVVEETEKQVIAPKKDEAKACIEGSKLILVVDDEVNIRKFLNHEITNRGHHVLEASRGKEAIELARKYHPDLITLDIVMPDISGFDVTSVLKSDPDTLDIPILIISVVEEKEKGYRLGASDYVTKPFDNKVLMDKIDVLLLGDKRKVLVVDDDESLAKAIKFELEKRGYTANVAPNGEKALRAIESNCPDLVILDLFMPRMDGYEVMKTLRNKPDTANIPIIVLTGIEIDGGRVKALSLGGTEYITKSGGLSKLFEEIENIFSKKSDVKVPESPLAYK